MLLLTSEAGLSCNSLSVLADDIAGTLLNRLGEVDLSGQAGLFQGELSFRCPLLACLPHANRLAVCWVIHWLRLTCLCIG